MIPRNPKLRRNAQELRKSMTKEERHLWYDCLSRLSVPFRKQRVIGKYIVDFYCHEAKLVIELDGSQHYEEDAAARDQERDAYLSSLGLIVLRYANSEVNQNFSGVCTDILSVLEARLGKRVLFLK